ncbi:MAG: hypothetical protein JRN09_03065 [Nitrososphaerota archaeon]|nr:hypothetical protein [Nitrososphaerota archaeon]
MRIKTSTAMKQVDEWKDLVLMRYRRFISSLSFLLVSVGLSRQLFLPTFFTVGLSLQFAFLELGSLIVLGALILKLNSYRLANLVLKGFTGMRA